MTEHDLPFPSKPAADLLRTPAQPKLGFDELLQWALNLASGLALPTTPLLQEARCTLRHVGHDGPGGAVPDDLTIDRRWRSSQLARDLSPADAHLEHRLDLISFVLS